MPSLAERIRAAGSAFRLGKVAVRSPRAPLAKSPAASMAAGGSRYSVLGERRNSRTLRKFSEQNVWVRVAINRRKREIARAEWSIVRVDDPKAEPNAKIVNAAKDLFNFVNDTRVNLAWLLNMLVEDMLVVDAGCLEVEKTAGDEIVALWPVPGEEIAPDPTWDGSKQNAPRYAQIRDGRVIARYRNDELIYMMANPRSNSPIGLSPLEVLMDTVEADLYGEDYEYQMMRETAPSGILYLGRGVPPDKAEAFREQWESEIAGTRDVAIIGDAMYDADPGTQASPPVFLPFKADSKSDQRREYMKWLATKVAAAFEMDLLAFNLSETIHRSIGANLQAKTDNGLIGLGDVISEFITREIMWVIDPSHSHGFRFLNLAPDDELAKAKIRQIYMQMGCTTPNEIRNEDGKEDVPWGDRPWPLESNTKAEDPAAGVGAEEDDETTGGKKPKPDDDEEED